MGQTPLATTGNECGSCCMGALLYRMLVHVIVCLAEQKRLIFPAVHNNILLSYSNSNPSIVTSWDSHYQRLVFDKNPYHLHAFSAIARCDLIYITQSWVSPYILDIVIGSTGYSVHRMT